MCKVVVGSFCSRWSNVLGILVLKHLYLCHFLSLGMSFSGIHKPLIRLEKYLRPGPLACSRAEPCPRPLPWPRRWWRITWLYTHSSGHIRYTTWFYTPVHTLIRAYQVHTYTPTYQCASGIHLYTHLSGTRMYTHLVLCFLWLCAF